MSFTSPFFQMPCGSSPQHELEIHETCRLVTLQEIWDVVLDDPVVIFCLFWGDGVYDSGAFKHIIKQPSKMMVGRRSFPIGKLTFQGLHSGKLT